MPKTPMVAVFDTGFHLTMPKYAYMYGIPYAELPRQNSQFGFGSANNNVYNTPRNPYYDQRGSFNQMGGFGGKRR